MAISQYTCIHVQLRTSSEEVEVVVLLVVGLIEKERLNGMRQKWRGCSCATG